MTTLEITLGEDTVMVTGTYTPSTPDVFYLRNGDPGQPGDPECFEIESVSKDGADITDLIQYANDKVWEETYKCIKDAGGIVVDLWELLENKCIAKINEHGK